MNRAKVFAIDVGVDLGGREIGMSQHLLHGAEIRSALEQMGGKAVPQRMRRDALGDPGPLSGAANDAPGTHAGERLAARIEQYPVPTLTPVESGAHLEEVHRRGAND